MSWRLVAAVAFVLVLGVGMARLTQDPDTGTLSWDATRASGFAGYILLWAGVCSGLLLWLRVRPGAGPLTWVLESHRMLSALGLAFVVSHVFGLLVDPRIEFSVGDVLIPFASGYRTVQTALGVTAEWLLVLVLATTALSNRMPYGAWKRLHLLAFPCWVLALVHGITTGTDAGARPALALYMVTGAAVGALVAIRLLGRESATADVRPLPARR